MELHFLGIGSAYNPALGNTNAFLLRGDDLVLVDCGESSFALLHGWGLLSAVRGDIYVLVTHLHADHAGSLPTLCSYARQQMNKRVHIVYPLADIRRFLRLAGIPSGQYHHLDGMREALCGLDVRAVPVAHVPGFASFGYLLDDGRETIYYSGDASVIPPQILSQFLKGDIGRLYQDVAWTDEGQACRHHLPFSLLCEAIAPQYRRQVTCMHMNLDYRTRAEAAGFQVARAWAPGGGLARIPSGP